MNLSMQGSMSAPLRLRFASAFSKNHPHLTRRHSMWAILDNHLQGRQYITTWSGVEEFNTDEPI